MYSMARFWLTERAENAMFERRYQTPALLRTQRHLPSRNPASEHGPMESRTSRWCKPAVGPPRPRRPARTTRAACSLSWLPLALFKTAASEESEMTEMQYIGKVKEEVAKFTELPPYDKPNSKLKALRQIELPLDNSRHDLDRAPCVHFVWAGMLKNISEEARKSMAIVRRMASPYTFLPVLWICGTSKLNELKDGPKFTVLGGNVSYTTNRWFLSSETSEGIPVVVLPDFVKHASQYAPYPDYRSDWKVALKFLECLTESTMPPHTRGDGLKVFIAGYLGGVVSDMDMIIIPGSDLWLRRHVSLATGIRCYFEGTGSPANGFFVTYPGFWPFRALMHTFSRLWDVPIAKNYRESIKGANELKKNLREKKQLGTLGTEVKREPEQVSYNGMTMTAPLKPLDIYRNALIDDKKLRRHTAFSDNRVHHLLYNITQPKINSYQEVLDVKYGDFQMKTIANDSVFDWGQTNGFTPPGSIQSPLGNQSKAQLDYMDKFVHACFPYYPLSECVPTLTSPVKGGFLTDFNQEPRYPEFIDHAEGNDRLPEELKKVSNVWG